MICREYLLFIADYISNIEQRNSSTLYRSESLFVLRPMKRKSIYNFDERFKSNFPNTGIMSKIMALVLALMKGDVLFRGSNCTLDSHQ